MQRSILLSLFASLLLCSSAWSTDFKFPREDQQEQSSYSDEQNQPPAILLGPCRSKIKNQKILVLFGEVQNGYILANQSSFSPYFDAINGRLRAAGLKTLTEGQIRQQVAQAEIDAYFKNDPDSALSASRRLAANYVLKGLITTSTGYNMAVRVNQVSVRLDFTLTDSSGKLISQANLENASYAGHDTSGMALTLINERADELVAKLYNDYCQGAASH
jgi:hypothetical protein